MAEFDGARISCTGRDYSQAGEWFLQAGAKASTLADPLLQAHSLNRLANWYVNTGRTAEGVQTHLEALAIFKTKQDQPGMGENWIYWAWRCRHGVISAADDLGEL